MGSTRQDMLQLITYKAEEQSFSGVFASIDVEKAECFDETAKSLIQSEIIEKHGSLAQFTAYLRLRFLLRPQLSYEADVEELLGRADDVWKFEDLRDKLQLQTAEEARTASDAAEAAAAAAAAATPLRPSFGNGGAIHRPPGVVIGGSAGTSPMQSPGGRRDGHPPDTDGGRIGEGEGEAEGGEEGAANGHGNGHGHMLSRAKSECGDDLLLNGTIDGPWGAGGRSPSVLACVVAGSGEGKSTFSAALTKEDWVDGWHFCKHSDARRQDPVLIAKSLSYQLAVCKNPAISGPFQARSPGVPLRPHGWRASPAAVCQRRLSAQLHRSVLLAFQSPPQITQEALLALDPETVAGMQKVDEAVTVLLLDPLRALPEGQTVVLLFDALDEAEAASASGAAASAPAELSTNALANPVLRFLSLLHGGDAGSHLRVVCTCRPRPPHVIEALQGRWGTEFFKLLPVAEMREAPAPAKATRRRHALSLNPELESSKARTLGERIGSIAPIKDHCAQPVSLPADELLHSPHNLLCLFLAFLAFSPVFPRALTPNPHAKQVFCFVAGELVARQTSIKKAPQSLHEAYEAWFTDFWPAAERDREPVAAALRLLMAAREPPSVNLLENVGVGISFDQLPGWRVLFQVRAPAPRACSALRVREC